MAYRPLMSEDRLVGASGCRSSRAFQGAAGRRSSGSSESATSRGEEASAVEGSCVQLPVAAMLRAFQSILLLSERLVLWGGFKK